MESDRARMCCCLRGARGRAPTLPGDVLRQACYLEKRRIRIAGRVTFCVPEESHPDSHSRVLVAGSVGPPGRKTSVVSSFWKMMEELADVSLWP